MNTLSISTQWVTHVTLETARHIIKLVDGAAADGGTLGYARPMTAIEAEKFIHGLRDQVGGNGTHVLLGLAHEEPVFMVMVGLNNMPNCRHRAELSKGIVRSDFRGRHLVELAFAEVIKFCATRGVEQLVLDVRENSRAHMLWQRFGFVSYGILEDYARIDGQVFRGHYMVQTVADLRQRLATAVAPGPTHEESHHA